MKDSVRGGGGGGGGKFSKGGGGGGAEKSIWGWGGMFVGTTLLCSAGFDEVPKI